MANRPRHSVVRPAMNTDGTNERHREGRAKVFLSHAFADFPVLQPVLDEFRRGQIDYWICEERIPDGANIPAAINEALAQCSHLLVFWSQAASRSRVTQDEVSGFYLRTKNAGRLLFVRLDATPVPTLYAAAAYVPTGLPAALIAQRVRAWLVGREASPENPKPGDAPQNPPGAHPLHAFPIGPMIDPEHITEDLIRGVAEKYEGKEPANDLINRANRFRLSADPAGNRHNMLLLAGDLGSIAEIGAYSFWSRALGLARRKSRRMLAALLLECDASGFPAKALADYKILLALLKQNT